eukprot:768724-Hanusia_phi.AAC.12
MHTTGPGRDGDIPYRAASTGHQEVAASASRHSLSVALGTNRDRLPNDTVHPRGNLITDGACSQGDSDRKSQPARDITGAGK